MGTQYVNHALSVNSLQKAQEARDQVNNGRPNKPEEKPVPPKR